MDNIVRIAAVRLTDSETSLYSNSNGAIIKTILLHNSNNEEKEVTLKFDGVTFLFKLEAHETRSLNNVVVTNSIIGIGAGVNIHISALQMEVQ